MSKTPSSSRSRRHSYHRRESKHSSEDEEDRLNVLCGKLRNCEDVIDLYKEDVVILRSDADTVPPFECFATEITSSVAKKKLMEDISQRLSYFHVGDELCVRVRRVELAGIFVQPICTLKPLRRYLKWISDFQVLVSRDLQDPQDYRPNDLIKAVVVEPDGTVPLKLMVEKEAGILTEDDLPKYFRNSQELKKETTFDEYIDADPSITNPNLSKFFGITVNSTISFLPELRGTDFTHKRRAPYVRRKQNEDLSMQSVLKGVERVREGQHSLAVQHFNKALDIDERNVEALVGRAAAYANMGQFALAETDLENALTINSDHVNAKAYMVETLLQFAKKLETENEINEAKTKYAKVLKLRTDPRAVQALRRLERSPSVEEVVVVKRRRKSKEEQKEEERKRRIEEEEEKKRRRQESEKLAEIEKFIAQLKNGTM